MYLSGIMGGSHFYIQIVILFICFFSCFVMEFGGVMATALYVLYRSFLSVCHFPVEGYQFSSNTEKPTTHDLQMSTTPKPLTDAAMPNVMYIV